MYEELGGDSFEIVAVAQDTGGEAAAGPFYDAAGSTFTSLIDPRHTVSALYDLVNVPTGIMIDEVGRIVRLDEGTYTRKYTAGSLEFGTDEYVPMLRDWLARGERSEYAKSPSEMAEELSRWTRERDEAEADAWFRLGVHLWQQGDETEAHRAWQKAQQLHPESWNYHRQDWSFEPSEAGRRWLERFQALEGRPYYRPLEEGSEN